MSRAALDAHCDNCGANTDDGDIYVIQVAAPVLGLDREGSVVLGYEVRFSTNQQVVFCASCNEVVTLISNDGEDADEA